MAISVLLLYGSINPVKPCPSSAALGEQRAPQAGQGERDGCYHLKAARPPAVLFKVVLRSTCPGTAKSTLGIM